MDERSKKFIEESEIMREIHEKAQQPDCECLGVVKVAEKTGLYYRDGGEVMCHGGYMPRGVMKGGIKEALIRWRWIDTDIENVQREMRLLESRFNDPAIASYVERMSANGGNSGLGGIDELLAKRETLERQFMDELTFLLGVRETIHKFVGILDEIDRRAVELRYLKGWAWADVAREMRRNETKLCWRVKLVLDHYDKTGEYLATKRYRRHGKRK